MAKTQTTIFVKDLQVMGRTGIYREERGKAQPLLIHLGVTFDYKRKKGETIKNVVSYEDAVRIIKDIISKKHYDLLETLGDLIIDAFMEDKRAKQVNVTIEKLKGFSPQKGLTDGVGTVGVTMVRKR